jgi:hypothetical protein
MENDGNYLIPVHEFSKSALLGDYSHYNPESSIAMNIFDVIYPDPREHFLIGMKSSLHFSKTIFDCINYLLIRDFPYNEFDGVSILALKGRYIPAQGNALGIMFREILKP